jgi:hypothetical protein
MRWARRTPNWGSDPQKDHHGGIGFRIQRQIKAYAKSDAPPSPGETRAYHHYCVHIATCIW